jgi:large subunit ribosomal protein L10
MKTKEKIAKREISPKKKALLKELVGLAEKNRTVMISSALNIPSALFQKIRKSLRGKAEIMIIKKNMGVKTIESIKKEGIQGLSQYISASSAFIFSSLDPYELARIFVENKQPAFAKAGQLAPEDLVIEKGPTDLPAGPAISELSAAGLKVGVEGGKIAVKETKVLVKKGNAIPKTAADVLQKLEIKPFRIEISVLAAYDSNDKKIYTNIIVDKEGFLNKLKGAFSSSYNFAVNLGYACKDTISQILERAEREALALQSLTGKQESQSQE